MAIPETIKRLANDVRTKIYGRDVRESIAKGIEVSGDIADSARQTSEDIWDKWRRVNTEWDSDPNKDPELVLARGDEENLSRRLIKFDDLTNGLASDLAQRGANVARFGAVADGITNDIEAFRSVAQTGRKIIVPKGDYYLEDETFSVPSNTIIEGDGYDSHLQVKNASARPIAISGENIIIRNLRIDGESQGGISIMDGAKNILIESCHFEDLNQVIWLHDCSNVTVRGCTFKGTGYGVIQQTQTASSHVKVIGNTVIDSKSDFVECNSVTMETDDWLVIGNQYISNANYSDTSNTRSENRFIGVTNVKSMIVANNYIKNAGGDSAIHCEDATGKVIITGNIFEDCKASQGNKGWIYMMGNMPEMTVITDNIFIKDDNLYTDNVAVSCASNVHDNRMIVSNNAFISRLSTMFGGLNLSNHYNSLVTGNYFYKVNVGIIMNNTHKSNISDNKFEKCNLGIGKRTKKNSGRTGDDNQVKDNVFIDNTIDLQILGNNYNTGSNHRWMITGNVFDGLVELSRHPSYGAQNSDFVFVANTLGADSELTDMNIDRYVRENNLKHGVGVI